MVSLSSRCHRPARVTVQPVSPSSQCHCPSGVTVLLGSLSTRGRVGTLNPGGAMAPEGQDATAGRWVTVTIVGDSDLGG